MNCEEAQELWEDYYRKELPKEQQHEVTEHLEQCSSCKEFFASAVEVHKAMHAVPERTVPGDLWAEISDTLDSKAQDTAPIWTMFRIPRYALVPAVMAVIMFLSLAGLQVERYTAQKEATGYIIEINRYLHSDISWDEEGI